MIKCAINHYPQRLITMRTLYSFFSLLVLVTLYSSCVPDPPLTPPAQLSEDSTYVKAIFQIDSLYPPGSDTVMKKYFSYDGNKRVSIIEIFNSVYQAKARRELFYRDHDTLPYKSHLAYDDGNSNTNFFTYKDGLVFKDSCKFYTNGTNTVDLVTTYTSVGANRYFVYTIRTEYPGGTPYAVDSIHTHRTIHNGNIIAMLDSVYTCHYGGTFSALWINSSELVYDDKPSPFKNIIPYPVETNVYFQNISSKSGVNNPLSRIETQKPGTSTFITPRNYSYKYLSNGLPYEINWTEVRPPNTSSPIPPYSKLRIIYGRV